MAKNLVDPIDQHLQEMRFYLFVSPHAKDPQPVAFTPGDADYFQEIKRLIGVTTGQAGFQDWITARGVNERIRLMDLRATELASVIAKGELDVPSLQTVSRQLLGLFFPNDQQLSPGSNLPESLPHARTRIATQYKQELATLQDVPNGAEAFRDSMLAFESAAGLGARDVMTIYGITAKESELAGGGLQAFLGFFDQKFRDHDYDTGRDHAQKILTDPALSQPGEIGPLRYTPGEIRPIDHTLDGLHFYQVPPADIDQFRKGLKHRVDQMLRKLSPWLVIAEPAANGIVDGIINHVTKAPQP